MVIYGLKPGTYKAYANTRYTSLADVSLCGILYQKNKFDLVGCDEKLAQLLLRNENITKHVTVVLNDGTIHSGKLYWWHDSMQNQHGIVCDINDKPANTDAAIKYNNRAPHLGKLI